MTTLSAIYRVAIGVMLQRVQRHEAGDSVGHGKKIFGQGSRRSAVETWTELVARLLSFAGIL